MSLAESRLRVLQSIFSRRHRMSTLVPRRAPGPLGHRRVLEQLLDDGADAFVDRRLQKAWRRARERDPNITPREFVRRARGRTQRLLRELLGRDQYVLETQQGGQAYWDAWQNVVNAWRYVNPPADCGHSFGHWDLPGLADLPARPERMLVPMDYPVIKDHGAVGYPGWPQATGRGHQLMAHVNFSRWRDRDVPLDIDAEGLIRLLPNLRAARLPYRSDLHPDLIQTPTQMAFTRHTGRAPFVAWQRLRPSERPLPGFSASNTIGSRQAQEARFELATRLYAAGRTDFASVLTESGIQNFNTAALRPSQLPNDPQNWSPFAQLELPELVKLARGEPDAPNIALHVFEIEHHRPERSARAMERLFQALDGRRPTGALANALRALCGFADPANVHLVTRFEHGRMDAFAAAFFGAENTQRIHDFANVRVRWMQAGDDPITDHTDRRRLQTMFLGFQPRQLLDVVELVRPRITPEALAGLDGAALDAFRDIVPAINRALQYYRRSDLYLDLPLSVMTRGLLVP